jgi:hypothetical protein
MTPSNPLLGRARLQWVLEMEFVFGVVMFCEIVQDGQSLHHYVTTLVVVYDGGNPPIYVQFSVPFLFLNERWGCDVNGLC